MAAASGLGSLFTRRQNAARAFLYDRSRPFFVRVARAHSRASSSVSANGRAYASIALRSSVVGPPPGGANGG